MTRIVAFTGKRFSGKDTAAAALTSYKKISFADPLRKIAEIAYGLTMEEMLDPILKEQTLDRYPFKTPREILTRLGTESFRHFIDDTWVKAFEREAVKHPFVTVADLRFLNEEKMLKENGACIIRIVNPKRNDTDATSQHKSETEMDQIDPHYTIINNDTIEKLHTNVRWLVGGFFYGK